MCIRDSPFSIARNDSVLEANALNSSENRYYEATRIAAQFYGGALIALDSLVAQGLDVDLTVLDMGDDQRTWSTALKDPAIKDIDLFIGPFHRSAIEQLARLNTRAHIVCPVQQSAKGLQGGCSILLRDDGGNGRAPLLGDVLLAVAKPAVIEVIKRV